MDLKHFILTHKLNKTLSNISDGFEKSEFVEQCFDAPLLVKSILGHILLEERQKQSCQLQSGGLANTKTVKNELNKKQSFCTEFNQTVSNILGLLGFEFSKYLFVLMGANLLIKTEIEDIRSTITYEDILTHVINIQNFMALGDESEGINSAPIAIDEAFLKTCNLKINDKEHHFNLITVDTNSKHKIFSTLVEELREYIKSNNVIMFEDNKIKWYKLLSSMHDALIMGTYIVNNIDELCINTSNILDIGYDKSFLKMFEILYRESFADIPYELWSNFKPHIQFVEKELKLDIKCSNYLNAFSSYYKHIHEETLKSALEKVPASKILNVDISDSCYELLADITFNLFVNLAKSIACNQYVCSRFAKSTRIQFVQIFNGILYCAPRTCAFSKSQRRVLHYILLSRKIIHDSIMLVNSMSEKEVAECLND